MADRCGRRVVTTIDGGCGCGSKSNYKESMRENDSKGGENDRSYSGSSSGSFSIKSEMQSYRVMESIKLSDIGKPLNALGGLSLFGNYHLKPFSIANQRYMEDHDRPHTRNQFEHIFGCFDKDIIHIAAKDMESAGFDKVRYDDKGNVYIPKSLN